MKISMWKYAHFDPVYDGVKIEADVVAQAYNPSYSGDEDKQDCSSRPTQANSQQDPEFKPQ
jgi:hypothetical protein